MLGLYPFKLKPIFKKKIWGGFYFYDLFNIPKNDKEPIGETWVLSALEENETIVENGHFASNSVSELTEVFLDDLMGEEAFDKYETNFPLLVKFIDARDYLSVQLHPNDQIAFNKHKQKFGKSELWYVLQADKNAHVIAGFNRKLNRNELEQLIIKNKLQDVLNYIPVKSGDIVYLPAGLVHALGPGVVLLEIQQSSDITYRLYDWGRVGEDGNPRELHIQDGLDAIDFNLEPTIITSFKPKPNSTTRMIDTPYFSVSWVNLQTILEKNLEIIDLFIIYVVLEGSCTLIYQEMKIDTKAGDCILVPAIIDKLIFLPQPSAQIVEIVPC